MSAFDFNLGQNTGGDTSSGNTSSGFNFNNPLGAANSFLGGLGIGGSSNSSSPGGANSSSGLSLGNIGNDLSTGASVYQGYNTVTGSGDPTGGYLGLAQTAYGIEQGWGKKTTTEKAGTIIGAGLAAYFSEGNPTATEYGAKYGGKVADLLSSGYHKIIHLF